MTPARGRRWRRSQAALASMLLLGILAYVFRGPVLRSAGRVLIVDDAAAAEYLIVAGGGADTRPFAAAALYRRKVAPAVLIFRHAPEVSNQPWLSLAHDEVNRRVLELEGVPAGAIVLLPDVVRSSWDEALGVRRFIGRSRPHRLIVVTSPEHTRRVRWLYGHVFKGTGVDIRTAAARHPRYDETNWWRDEQGTLAFLHEYFKLPFYWVHYGFRRSEG